MLEQAIVDATALREAALKNAEQAIIEKYAPQIKDAVESLLRVMNLLVLRWIICTSLRVKPDWPSPSD